MTVGREGNLGGASPKQQTATAAVADGALALQKFLEPWPFRKV